MSNFRPVSVLCHLAKIIEMIMYLRFNKYVIANKLLHKNQYGFVKKSNTTAATVNLLNIIRGGLDNKKITATMFVDLRKAFDTVSISILILKN